MLVHDWGYWGCENIDGPEGQQHPMRGARLAQSLMSFFKASPERIKEIFYLIVCHSQSKSRDLGLAPSKLCWPDKHSIYFDPPRWYLFRARLSKEIVEYRRNAVISGHVEAWESDRAWYDWLSARNVERAEHNATGL